MIESTPKLDAETDLTSDVDLDEVERGPEFLQKLELLMREYRVHKVDVGWRCPTTPPAAPGSLYS